MKTKKIKVEQFYHANQFIIKDENGVYFQSYDSLIAWIDENKNLTLGYHWDYSNTTLRHLYLFMNEYNFNHKYEFELNSKGIRKAIQSDLIAYDFNMI